MAIAPQRYEDLVKWLALERVGGSFVVSRRDAMELHLYVEKLRMLGWAPRDSMAARLVDELVRAAGVDAGGTVPDPVALCRRVVDAYVAARDERKGTG